MKFFCSILISACWVVTGCFSSKSIGGNDDSLAATALIPVGRTLISDHRLELISSAAHFGFSFEGTDCEVLASIPDWLDHNFIQYEMDGSYVKRLSVSKGGVQRIRLAAGDNGKHTVWMYKATEATTGPVFIHQIRGAGVQPVTPPLEPAIEFIGNSITCGAAADPSEIPCGTGPYHDQHNAYYSYGPVVARKLKVDYVMSSVSGIGIYRTWNREEPSMPKLYEKADFSLSSNRAWDFTTHHPRIVSIALGTNDLSNGDGKTARAPFDSARFVNDYIDFVLMVRSKYPAARIALLNSPIVEGSKKALLENCLTAIKNKVDSLQPSSTPLALYFFTPRKGQGCTGHPNLQDHAEMAEEITPFFQNLLKL